MRDEVVMQRAGHKPGTHRSGEMQSDTKGREAEENTMFTFENTEGYTAEQINALNSIAARIRAELISDGFAGDEPELQQVADERAQREMDN